MNWYIKRLTQSVITLFAVVTLSFAIIRLLPGGPMDYLRAQLQSQGSGMTQQQINRLVETHTNVNPEQPVWLQYIDYMSSLAIGDLGVSTWYNDPVNQILGQALPWTVFYMSISLFLMFGIGIILGAIMGYREGSRFDISATFASTLLNSIPYYVAAILLVFILGYQFNFLPTGGRYASDVDQAFTLEFIQSALLHATLPVVSLVITEFGFQALAMRGNSIRVLGEDYLRVARLRGLGENHIAVHYVGRNAVLPMYTQFMIAIGFMFGGSVILEEVFSYAGVGYYIYASVQARDYPLMMGGFIVITVAVVLGVLIADLTYGQLDPRAGSADASKKAYGGNMSLGQFVDLLRGLVLKPVGIIDRSTPTSGTSTSDADAIKRYMPDDEEGLDFDDEAVVTDRREQYRMILDQSVLAPLRIIWSDWRARVGLVIIGLYGLMGLIAVVSSSSFWIFEGVTLVDEPSTRGPILEQPFETWAHPMGTDMTGQDIWASVVHATPAMLEMIIAGAVFTTVVATVVGTVSGYMGGKADQILMTINDIAMTIPGLPLVIVLAVIIEPRQAWVVGIVLSINAWAGLARSLRSQVLTLRDEGYVEASRTMNVGTGSIISEDVLPNLMPYIFVNFVNSARNVIFASVGLYFLGILPFTNENWGVMMNMAYTSGGALYTWQTAHWLFFPMLAVVLLSFGLILFAQGTDRVFNPRVRARHAKTVKTDDETEAGSTDDSARMIR